MAMPPELPTALATIRLGPLTGPLHVERLPSRREQQVLGALPTSKPSTIIRWRTLRNPYRSWIARPGAARQPPAGFHKDRWPRNEGFSYPQDPETVRRSSRSAAPRDSPEGLQLLAVIMVL